MEGPDPLEYNGAPFDLRITEDETYSGANIDENDSPETRIVNKGQQMDNRAKIKEVNNERGDTKNNIGNQGEGEHDEIYMNEESIETLKFIRPAGNIMLPSQNSYFLEDPDQLEYEEAPLELQIKEDEKYSRADIRDYDSP